VALRIYPDFMAEPCISHLPFIFGGLNTPACLTKQLSCLETKSIAMSKFDGYFWARTTGKNGSQTKATTPERINGAAGASAQTAARPLDPLKRARNAGPFFGRIQFKAK
jgi:hypothetical protein